MQAPIANRLTKLPLFVGNLPRAGSYRVWEDAQEAEGTKYVPSITQVASASLWRFMFPELPTSSSL